MEFPFKRQAFKGERKETKKLKERFSLSKEDLEYLKKLIIDFNIKDKDNLYLAAMMLEGGKGRENPNNGYKLKPETDNHYDMLHVIASNASNTYMSEEIGKYLENLSENGKYKIFIHRPGGFMYKDNFIEKVFKKGLINNGDLMTAGAYMGSRTNLGKTLTYTPSVPSLIHYIKNALEAPYKIDKDHNLGVFIAKIPSKTLEEGKPIYYLDYETNEDGVSYDTLYLHPMYIDGFLEFDNNKIISYKKNSPENYKDLNEETIISDSGSNKYRGK